MDEVNESSENPAASELILSEDFDRALEGGADIKSEINGTMKQKVKNNYDRFYDIMLMSRPDIQSICDKKKKDRTADDNESLKEFSKLTKRQYRSVKDMMFLSEDEMMNDDGTSNTVPKKVRRLVERLSAAYAILKYIGCETLDDELDRNGLEVIATPLEATSEIFENERIQEDMREIFDESCRVYGEIDSAERRIREDIFVNMVPAPLQFDKDTNPSGLKDGDFKKLVDAKYKMLKSEKSGDEEARQKASERVMDEAEKKTFEIERNKTIRVGLIALGADSGEDGDTEDEGD